jgi:hypothetical protein
MAFLYGPTRGARSRCSPAPPARTRDSKPDTLPGPNTAPLCRAAQLPSAPCLVAPTSLGLCPPLAVQLPPYAEWSCRTSASDHAGNGSTSGTCHTPHMALPRASRCAPELTLHVTRPSMYTTSTSPGLKRSRDPSPGGHPCHSQCQLWTCQSCTKAALRLRHVTVLQPHAVG